MDQFASMATLSHSVSVFSDGSVQVREQVLPPAVRYFRVKHDAEPLWRKNLPEVFRLDPDAHVVLTEPVQWLIHDMNPTLTGDQFRALFGDTLAFTNGTGIDGRRDYINRRDLDAEKCPAFDQMRVCGGAILRGEVVGSKLIVESVDVRKPIPSAAFVLANRHLWFEAVNIDWSVALDGPIIRPFKGNWGKPVYFPVLTSVDASFPLAGMTEIDPRLPFPSTYRYP